MRPRAYHVGREGEREGWMRVSMGEHRYLISMGTLMQAVNSGDAADCTKNEIVV